MRRRGPGGPLRLRVTCRLGCRVGDGIVPIGAASRSRSPDEARSRPECVLKTASTYAPTASADPLSGAAPACPLPTTTMTRDRLPPDFVSGGCGLRCQTRAAAEASGGRWTRLAGLAWVLRARRGRSLSAPRARSRPPAAAVPSVPTEAQPWPSPAVAPARRRSPVSPRS